MHKKDIEINEKYIVETIKKRLGIEHPVQYKFFRGADGRQFLRFLIP